MCTVTYGGVSANLGRSVDHVDGVDHVDNMDVADRRLLLRSIVEPVIPASQRLGQAQLFPPPPPMVGGDVCVDALAAMTGLPVAGVPIQGRPHPVPREGRATPP